VALGLRCGGGGGGGGGQGTCGGEGGKVLEDGEAWGEKAISHTRSLLITLALFILCDPRKLVSR
jgi:hypothetical protein